MSKIKAIETEYKGYRFRSRLEARWAVFFDTLGIPYQYEPEGFDLNGVWYLPDFYLAHLDYYIEIKPASDEDAIIKMTELCLNSRKDGRIFMGSPWWSIKPPYQSECETIGFRWPPSHPICLKQEFIFNLILENGAGFKVKEGCDLMAYRVPWLDIEYWKLIEVGILKPYNGQCKTEKGRVIYAGDLMPHDPQLLRARDAARQARFEHGEKGI